MNLRFLNKLHTSLKGYRCSVYLYAFADLNVGDDLFLHKLISSYPDVRFVMIARPPYKQMLSRYPNVTVWEEGSFPLRLCSKLGIAEKISWRISHECDFAVYIAGSIFMEYPEWENQHLWYRELFDNQRLYFLGCSWGPCRTKEFETNMADVLSGVKDICFRDRYSYRIFSHLPNVRYAPDILLGLDWSKFAGIEEKKQVLISVVDCNAESINLEKYASEYNHHMTCIAEQFARRGYDVILCSFWENGGDLKAAEEILRLLSPQARVKASVVSYCGTNMEDILLAIAESEYVVATRFHATILAMVAGKKVLPVIYHIKTRNVLEDLSFQGPYLDIQNLPKDPAGIIDGITRGIGSRERETLAQLAAGHFEAVNRVLRDET